jgi:hypothetical protein
MYYLGYSISSDDLTYFISVSRAVHVIDKVKQLLYSRNDKIKRVYNWRAQKCEKRTLIDLLKHSGYYAHPSKHSAQTVIYILRYYAATSWKVAGSSHDEMTVNLPNPSSHTRPWGLLTLREMSTRNRRNMFLGSRARQVRKADNLTPICKSIV